MRDAWVVVVLAACEFPAAGRFPCEPDGTCADGNVCIDQLCVPEPARCVEAVGAGGEHTCVIRDDHTAWCWGRNNFGQLGDGTTDDRSAPVQVLGDTRFVAIAAGDDHTCALAEDKTVWCWGSNELGQLTRTADSLQPVQVAALTGVQAIASGGLHSCALVENGTVSCWGANTFGQLGNNSMQASVSPGLVQGLDGLAVAEIVAYEDTTCAIARADPALYCWGENLSGQFADRSIPARLVPVAVQLPDVAHVAIGGDSLCALTAGGDVYCAGDPSSGRLGSPDASGGTPVRVALPVKAGAIAMGESFACATELRDARHEQQRVWCWGDNSFLQLTDATSHSHPSPILTEYTNIAAVSGGRNHLCARSATGGITCSGFNSHGQLGDGSRTTRPAPPPAIEGLTGVTAVAAGGLHTCAVARESVLCWGDNELGQLGDGSTLRRDQPTLVEGVERAMNVAAGGAHSCALLPDRTAMCWGLNSDGQVGDRTSGFRSVPRAVVESTGMKLENIRQIATGGAHTCALLGNGVLKCWGDNSQGQLGDGSFIDRNAPVNVTQLLGAVHAIALGNFHTCALVDNSVGLLMMCWGINGFGQLGNTQYMGNNSNLPVQVMGSFSPVQLAAHGDFTCAIADDGIVRCWGSGGAGQMGDGAFMGYGAPRTAVSKVTLARQITAGGAHACALAASGLECWGASRFGQLGGATYSSEGTPVSVMLPGSAPVTALTAGDQHTCALLDDATVTCWGDGRAGQLGDGAFERRSRIAPLLPCP